MSADASSTTVHRRLKTLRQKNMLELEVDEDDNRVKYIVPTELARNYLAELGKSVERASRPGQAEPSVTAEPVLASSTQFHRKVA